MENKTSEKYRIVALLDKPSPKSFGMLALLVAKEGSEYYETRGLAKGIRQVTQREFERMGLVLAVDLDLPPGLSNPVALWIGDKFYTDARRLLENPVLPQLDDTWNHLHSPHSVGSYSIKEPQIAHKALDDFVKATAPEALRKNSNDLAWLMHWTMPDAPETAAAWYLTQPSEELKERALSYHMKFAKDSGKPVSREELIRRHEEVRQRLL